ncbi:MAG TPA: TULIP family P47-like protein, partial [Polyangium sp.]|nr:TULIP family P47-like protein [Polyangium sp.]
MNTTSNVSVYTYNWDTVFAIPVSDVNKAIIDHKSSPANFRYEEAGSYTLSANFGAWQMSQGGDGKNVRFTISMTDIVVTYATGKTVTCASGTAVIEINLHFIPHTESASASSGKPMALKAKTVTDDPSIPIAALVGQPVLSPDPGTITTAVIGAGLLQWVLNNLDEFNHIFAIVDLNLMVDQGQWGFVTPNYTSYAYLDGGTVDSSIFGVLTMTGTRTGESLSEQISPSAIPKGSRAGFLVSQERTLCDLVRPAIMRAYPGLSDATFLMSDDKTKLYLANNVSVDLAPVEHDGSTYHPKLTSLTVETDGETYTVTSVTSTYISFGITATSTTTNWYTLELGTSKNGQTIVFKQTQPADEQHTIEQDPGVIITEIIVSIVVAVASLVLAIVTDG